MDDTDLVESAQRLCDAFADAPDSPPTEVVRANRLMTRFPSVAEREATIFVTQTFSALCPEAAPPEPKMNVRFSTSCEDDYPQVFQMDPYRFVAETKVLNRGNKVRVRVDTSWLFFGGGKVTSTKWVDLEPGASRRVPFSKPATQDQVLRMTGWRVGDKMCKTTASALWYDDRGRVRFDRPPSY